MLACAHCGRPVERSAAFGSEFCHMRSQRTHLPPRASSYFDAFLVTVKLSSLSAEDLNPHDWRKFYQFVKHCHQRRVALTDHELEELLIGHRMQPVLASRIADAYRHGRGTLKATLLDAEDWERTV